MAFAMGIAGATTRGDDSPPPGWELLPSGPISPLEARLLRDGVANDDDGANIAAESLLDAALIASGEVRPDELARYRRRFDAWCVELRSTAAETDDARLAARIVSFLHTRVCTGGFQANCVDLRRTIDRGEFNCLTSVILFQCLARRSGLTATAVEVPRHTFCELANVLGPQRDVETTCPTWLDPMTDDLAAAPWMHERRSGPRRQLNSAALVALVYYNRGVAAIEAGRHQTAVAANLAAVRLDPTNQRARGNLLAAVNNWSVALVEQRRFGEAVELLSLARYWAPRMPALSSNFRYAYHRWDAALRTARGEPNDSGAARDIADGQPIDGAPHE